MSHLFKSGDVLKVVDDNGTWRDNTARRKGDLVTVKGSGNFVAPSVQLYEEAGTWFELCFVPATGSEVRNAVAAGKYAAPIGCFIRWQEDQFIGGDSSLREDGTASPYVNNTSLFTTKVNKTLQDYLDGDPPAT